MNITINISAPELAKAIDNLAIALLNPKLTSLALPQSSINRIKRETKEVLIEKVTSEAKEDAAAKMEQLTTKGNLYTPPDKARKVVTEVTMKALNDTAVELTNCISARKLRAILDNVVGTGVLLSSVPKEKYKDLMNAMEVALKF
jgi:hypothetical protein|tara:strand:+ start:3361 stop:3795 length:435 start_codon:yes stop_codon:yes gene_type:complete